MGEESRTGRQEEWRVMGCDFGFLLVRGWVGGTVGGGGGGGVVV